MMTIRSPLRSRTPTKHHIHTIPLPRSLNHTRHHKITRGKLSFMAILVVGLSLIHTISWSLSLSSQEKKEEEWQSHRLNVIPNSPTSRNGAILRHEHRSITDYDRQQDIHRYTASMDKPRIVILSSSPPPSTPRRSVEAISNYTPPNNTLSYIWDFELPYHQECTPMESWQTTFYPTCNILHEVQADQLLSTKGSWRTAWLTENEKIVLKMLNFDRTYDTESYSYHQVDAMAMERLTFSKHSIDAYGFCGQSVLVEFASGEGRDLIKNKKLSSIGRLLIGRDLARGINDVHSMDAKKSRNATFVHNDVNIANIVAMSSGRIKFSDFNIGYPLKWNKTKPCGYPQRWEGKLWRSPEEIRNTTYVSVKTDVYSLGNLLFQVMTRHQPWTWLEPNGRPTLDEIAQSKLEGKTPFIPNKFVNSTDMAVQALYHAIRACFQQDPNKRPTAYQVSYGLYQALKWIKEGNKTMRITEDLFFH